MKTTSLLCAQSVSPVAGSGRVACIASWVILLATALFISPVLSAAAPQWWNTAWSYREPVVVTDPNPAAVSARYSVKATLDAQLMMGTGQLLANCADLRVVYFDGSANYELDRIVNGCGTAQTEIWFALQRPIAGGAQDNGYYLYYGNSAAGLPPTNGMNVFLFYEDWENGASHWTNAGGLDSANTGTMGTSTITTDDAVSPSHSQKFTEKTYGGDAFTGYIPVSPNTSYALSVWAKSATGTYFPVGFDPYTANYSRNTEVWLWTSEWTLGSQWAQRTATFTTNSTTAYLKLKSEWWISGPGTSPVYCDNLALRYTIINEPQVSLGAQESTIPGPTVSEVTATTPIDVGSSTKVSAYVATNGTTIDYVNLRVLSPEIVDIPMVPGNGDNLGGTWQVQFTPAQGGAYTFVILAHATNSLTGSSPTETFTVVDTQPPQIVLISVTDPIPVNNLQTLTVQVTYNCRVGTVKLNADGTDYPMAAT